MTRREMLQLLRQHGLEGLDAETSLDAALSHLPDGVSFWHCRDFPHGQLINTFGSDGARAASILAQHSLITGEMA